MVLTRATVAVVRPALRGRIAVPNQAPKATKGFRVTPKIAKFLAAEKPPTPCLVLDLDRVEENFAAMRAVFPDGHIYYAVKANPARPVLERLRDLGSRFDAASWEEIELCLQAGITADRISFGNTIKKATAIRRAAAAGIDLFVFDSGEELEKIAQNAPGARVFCRLAVGTVGSVFPLARKFGAGMELASELLLRARDLGLQPYGLSFHAGSQQTSAEAHEAAIGQVAMLFDELEQAGIRLQHDQSRRRISDPLPGGYPSDFATFAQGIDRAMRFHFGNRPPKDVSRARPLHGGRCRRGQHRRSCLASHRLKQRPAALDLSRHRQVRRPVRDRGRGDALRIPHALRRNRGRTGHHRRTHLRQCRHPL